MNVRARAWNIIKLLPGPKMSAMNAKNEIQCIELFLTDEIIFTITTCTSIYIASIREKYIRYRDIDEIEIRAFIWILFITGSLRSSRKNLEQIWDNSKGSGVESCYITMS